MALLKVPEFAEKYNIKRTNVYTYQKRGKLIITSGYIDEESAVNKIFIESREVSQKVKTKPSAPKESNKIPIQERILKASDSEEKKVSEIKNDKKTQLFTEFRESNKIRDEKLKLENELTQIRIDKIRGKLIPTDKVKVVLSEVVHRHRTIFHQQTEQLLRDLLNELQAGNQKITEACNKLTDIANESSKRCNQEIKINLSNIINESIIK